MKFTLGTKEEMLQVFDEEGVVYPVTAIKAGPIVVTQIKTKETDGYNAVQVGFRTKSDKNLNKAQKGHLKDNGNFKDIREFRIDNPEDYKVGEVIDLSNFEKWKEETTDSIFVEVSALSKGKGFQGAVKRHGFAGGPRTHGQKHSERKVGSIGSTGPQRVFKGTRMAGRMGYDRITVKNLKVVGIDVENNKLLIRGAIPGRRGTLVEIRG
jgi:large subunit ribosomal protein L3